MSTRAAGTRVLDLHQYVHAVDSTITDQRTLNTTQVSVKVIRVRNTDPSHLTMISDRLIREIKVWGRLQNDHILPLLGLFQGYGPLPGLVSPLMDNGTLVEFLHRRHDTLTRCERFRLVGFFGYD